MSYTTESSRSGNDWSEESSWSTARVLPSTSQRLAVAQVLEVTMMTAILRLLPLECPTGHYSSRQAVLLDLQLPVILVLFLLSNRLSPSVTSCLLIETTLYARSTTARWLRNSLVSMLLLLRCQKLLLANVCFFSNKTFFFGKSNGALE